MVKRLPLLALVLAIHGCNTLSDETECSPATQGVDCARGTACLPVEACPPDEPWCHHRGVCATGAPLLVGGMVSLSAI